MQKILAKNKRASFDYELLERFEAGISLLGHEVKSLKGGHGHFTGSYITISNAEAFLHHFHIAPFEKSTLEGYQPERTRKLLLHKTEIRKIASALSEKGVTVVPLECGLEKNRIKISLASVRGKKKYDKREAIKKRDIQRRIERY